MPGSKKATRPVSSAQARLFGAVAGGGATKATGLSKAEAKRKLKGAKVGKLPAKAGKRKKGK